MHSLFPAIPPCSNCSAASIPVRWVKCHLCRPPLLEYRWMPSNWDCKSILKAKRIFFRSSADLSAATRSAGILATELTDMPGPTLLVDIGTNGEIVLWANGKLTAASTAAGPAFEGARISCGMRGSTGAIEKVVVDGHLRINVIGNVPPAGLCGSGLIDVAAELLRHKVLNPQGKLLTPDQLPSDVLPDLRRRIVLHEGKVAFCWHPKKNRPQAGRWSLRNAIFANCNWPPGRFAQALQSC